MSSVLSTPSIRRMLGRSYVYDQPLRVKRRKHSIFGVTRLVSVLCLMAIATNLIAIKFFASSGSNNEQVVYAASQKELPLSTTVSEEVIPEGASLVQSQLNDWIARQQGDFSLSIYDLDNQKMLAEVAPTKQFFGASIYKLYVAYASLAKVDNGSWKLSDIVLEQTSLGDCIDAMIVKSDNLCGSAVAKKYGYGKLNQYFRKLGFKSFDFNSLQFSAADSVMLLQRLSAGTDLTDTSSAKLLNQMSVQKYRSGLPAGFTGGQVWDKVGFLGSVNHDAGLVKTRRGRNLAVVIMTEGSSMAKIAELAAIIDSTLAE